MKTTKVAVRQQPIWVAALLASAASGRTDALIHRLRWESGRASLRLTNGGPSPVFIPALGVELGAGTKVEVRWPAGATGYEVRFNRAA